MTETERAEGASFALNQIMDLYQVTLEQREIVLDDGEIINAVVIVCLDGTAESLVRTH